jgi:translation initiation factor IF-1
MYKINDIEDRIEVEVKVIQLRSERTADVELPNGKVCLAFLPEPYEDLEMSRLRLIEGQLLKIVIQLGDFSRGRIIQDCGVKVQIES